MLAGPLRGMFAVLSVLLAGACAQAPQTQPLAITGVATYRERMLLPPQAVFEASVEDVARADAVSTMLGHVRIEAPQVPVRFSIPVDAARVAPNGRYVVRARITLDGRLLFTSDTAHAVLGSTGNRQVEILLHRVSGPALAAETRRMSGHYSYLADAALFIDCASGERMAVAEEGDNAALQRAYLAARPAPGAVMLATVEGRVQARPAAEGKGPAMPTLVVDRFLAIRAGSCGLPHGTSPLEDTYWRLTHWQGRPATMAGRQREPHASVHLR